MNWEQVGPSQRAQLSDGMFALITPCDSGWNVSVMTTVYGEYVHREHVGCETAAKVAVCHWIGKTIAQLGNAVAAGEQFPDDGN